MNLGLYIDQAQKAEAAGAGIAFAFVANGPYINKKSTLHFLNRFEQLMILPALAATTSKTRLAGTASTSYSAPIRRAAIRIAKPDLGRALGLESGDDDAGGDRAEPFA